ncbi:hypothetical protein [Cupriavidus sp. TMH.W2]|uniref:hypothetical protein n=1 Tax=Cupriavidus sp. TMH.W2 TaxID=3434465 RepID=UPI003D7706A3
MKLPVTHPSRGPASVLSTDHQRILHSQFCHLDERLAELEQVLVASTTVDPVDTAGIRREPSDATHDRITRLRAALADFARNWQIDMTRFQATPSQLALVHLAFLLVDLDELSPAALRGYGPIDATFVDDYKGLLAELHHGLERLKRDVCGTDAAGNLD